MRTQLGVALAATLVLHGCGILTPDADELSRLDRAEALWAQNGPARYQVTVDRLCFCPLVTARITVENGEITNLSFPELVDREPLEWELEYARQHLPSVEDAFPYLREILASGPDSFEADYRPLDGLPLQVSVDHWKDAVDDEWTLRYRDLVPLTDGAS